MLIKIKYSSFALVCFIARLADQYVAHKATNKYWNTGIGLVALKATGVPKSDPKIGKIQKYSRHTLQWPTFLLNIL